MRVLTLISVAIGLVLGGTAPAAAQRDDCAVLPEAARWVRVMNLAEDWRVIIVQSRRNDAISPYEPGPGEIFIGPLPDIDEYRTHQADHTRHTDEQVRRIREELEQRRDHFANEWDFNAAVFEALLEAEPFARPGHWRSEPVRAPADLVQTLRDSDFVAVECTREILLEEPDLGILIGEEVQNEDGGQTLRIGNEQYHVELADWAYELGGQFFSFIRPGPIAYSADANLALLEVGFHCGPLCGAGWLMLLERQADGSWVAIAANMTWIS